MAHGAVPVDGVRRRRERDIFDPSGHRTGVAVSVRLLVGLGLNVASCMVSTGVLLGAGAGLSTHESSRARKVVVVAAGARFHAELLGLVVAWSAATVRLHSATGRVCGCQCALWPWEETNLL